MLSRLMVTVSTLENKMVQNENDQQLMGQMDKFQPS